MSVVPNPPSEHLRLTILPANEALRRARPLPTDDEMAIEGITDDEWMAFEAALKNR